MRETLKYAGLNEKNLHKLSFADKVLDNLHSRLVDISLDLDKVNPYNKKDSSEPAIKLEYVKFSINELIEFITDLM